MRLQDNLTNDHEKRYNSIHQQRSLLNVLRRSIEIAVTSRHITSDCSTGGYAMNTVEKLLARNTNVYESELLLSCVLEKEFGRTVVRIFLRKSSSRSIKNSFSTVFDVKQSFEGRNFENSVRASALFNTSRSFILLATVGIRPITASPCLLKPVGFAATGYYSKLFAT